VQNGEIVNKYRNYAIALVAIRCHNCHVAKHDHPAIVVEDLSLLDDLRAPSAM
jgi:hypothetical protein